jgi:predicted transglutaminase-like cysteine proteinase
MLVKALVSILVLAGACSASFAAGAAPGAMKVFGKSMPPVGYVQFCASGQAECNYKGHKTDSLTLDATKWDLLNTVNAYTNAKIAPKSDQDLYAVTEKWTYPTTAGDCEDYVLLKKHYLQGLGVPADDLLITVLLDEKNEGHAVLTVVTSKGDFILDNRRDEIVRWDNTNYKFLKRQSQANPTKWVSLRVQPSQVVVSSK